MDPYPKQNGNEALSELREVTRDASGTSEKRLRCGDIEVDCEGRTATIDGMALELTHGEFALLIHFIGRANRLVTRPELLAHVWSMPSHTGSNVVDVVVCRLRRRLGVHGRMIETVRGLGYRFRAPDRGPSITAARWVEPGSSEGRAARV
jgi:two-component system OmpR family response regulator